MNRRCPGSEHNTANGGGSDDGSLRSALSLMTPESGSTFNNSNHRPRVLAAMLNNVGVLVYNAGHHDEAMKYYNQASRVRLTAAINDDKGNNKSASSANLDSMQHEINNVRIFLGRLRKKDHIKDKDNPLGRNLNATTNKHADKIFPEDSVDDKDPAFFDSGVEINDEESSFALVSDEVDTAITVYNCALIHRKIGAYEQSRKAFELALSLCLENDRRSILVVKIYNNIALIYYHAKQYDKALASYTDALLFLKQLRSVYSVHKATSRKGDAISALSQALDFLPYRNANSCSTNARNELLATTLSNIGRIWFRRQNYHKALLLSQAVRQIRSRLVGENSHDVRVAQYNIGLTYYMRGELFRALQHFTEDKPIMDDSFAVEDLIMVAKIQVLQDQREQAMTTLSEALQRNSKRADSHPSLSAEAFLRIGRYLLEHEDIPRAIETFKMCISTVSQSVSTDQMTRCRALVYIGLCHQDQARLNEAKDTYTEAIVIATQSLGRIHAVIVCLLQLIANIHREQGDLSLAQDHLHEASYIRLQILYLAQENRVSDAMPVMKARGGYAA